MADQPESPLERMLRLYAEGDLSAAIAAGEASIVDEPGDVELRERVVAMLVEAAQHDPAPEHLARALEHLNHALSIEPARSRCLEIRANVLNLLGYRSGDDDSMAAVLYNAALNDFRALLSMEELEEEDREGWRIEAARAAFLAMRHGDPATADYGLVARLYAEADSEGLLPADWFFRGLTHRDLAARLEDPRDRRTAAACFLRAIESGSYPVEGRYFAADELLQLEAPTEQEMAQSTHLIEELESTVAGDSFLLRSLKQRLQLRRDLLGKGPSLEAEKDDA